MQGIMWIVFFFIMLILIILSVDLVRKNKRKYVSVAIVIMVVLIGIFFGIKGENRSYEYFYIIQLKPNDLSEYELYLPMALDAGNRPHGIMDDMDVTGNADVDIIDTIHGKALKISGSGNIKIYSVISKGKTTFYGDPIDYGPIFHLSMYGHTDSGTDYHWLYYNNSKRFSVDIAVSASINQGHSNGRVVGLPWAEFGEESISDIDYTQLDTGWFSVGFRQNEVVIG